MKIFNSIYGEIVIPDTKQEILSELVQVEQDLYDGNYSGNWLESYMKALYDGLDRFRRRQPQIER
jgi:hypothetical protein